MSGLSRASNRARLALVCAVAAALLQQPSYASPHSALNRLPMRMLWAWERPEDLRNLPAGTGVAFLAQTVRLKEGALAIDGRRQPLRVSPNTTLIAVTRIEAEGLSFPSGAAARTAEAILRSASLPRVAGLQIDFDAVVSQRLFYRDVLARVRAAGDPAMPLSMTALASWCVGDRWLTGLPVDEAIPMLFRMGPLNEPFRNMAQSIDGVDPLCRHSVGTSLDEPLPLTPRGRRVYVFNPKRWGDSR